MRDFVRGLRKQAPPVVSTPGRFAPSLRDPALDARLQSDGYVVVDLFEAPEVDRLLQFCRTVHPDPVSTWESDFYAPDREVKVAVHEEIREAMAPEVERVFVGHRTVLHNFILNWPGPGGGLVLHQHSSVVDERRFRSTVVWCALTDATEANGTLHVVPRSHHLQIGPHPERSTSWAVPHMERLLAEHLTSVPLRAGQAIVFDNQLLHCSFANATNAPRVSMASIVVPNEAEPLFYEAVGSSQIRIHQLVPEFFMDNEAGALEWASPDSLSVVDEVSWEPTVVDAADLERVLPRGTCRHEAS